MVFQWTESVTSWHYGNMVLLYRKLKAQFPYYFSTYFYLFIFNMQLSTHYNSWENLFMPYANNKGAEQPALPCSLTIIIFCVGCLNCIIPILAESSWAGHFESYRVAKPQRQVFSWSGSKYLIWVENCTPHSLSQIIAPHFFYGEEWQCHRGKF